MSQLNQTQREFLLKVARAAVEAAATSAAPPEVETLASAAGLSLDGALTENRGAFVTLTRHGHLRGCIGFIEGYKPLVQAVAENGRSAAVSDPRFPPLTPGELEDLNIEVSALTALVAVKSYEDIEVGKHGILLEKNGRQSVFLPQVATEQGWDLATTLTHLALKAGLDPDGWREGADFRVFKAEVF